MCGIVGVLDPASLTDSLEDLVRRMADQLAHRGPDDSGSWVEPSVGLAFGHRRLSIIDLSPTGHQPIADRSGRWTLLFNGEIYNHAALRRELVGSGAIFRGTSDTEVLVEALAAWGLDETLSRLNGMFALAAWDASERCVHLVRDRLGEKPLYYVDDAARFAFASELKALTIDPRQQLSIDPDALNLFLRVGYVPGARSIYRGIRKVPPGAVVTITIRSPPSIASPRRYWSLAEVAERGRIAPFAGSFDDAVDELGRLLTDAVALRAEADVPVGAFLSGGIDSTAVVAALVRGGHDVRTFTAAFPGSRYDEADDAAAVARVLGTQHTVLTIDPSTVPEVLNRLPEIYDEPLADPSQIPSVQLAAMTRQHVTVALSGDGGDEVFAGYNRHTYARAVWRVLSRVPAPMRRTLAAALGRVPPDRVDRFALRVDRHLPDWGRVRNPGDKLQKLGTAAGAHDPAELYELLVSHWPKPPLAGASARRPALVAGDDGPPPFDEWVETFIWLDTALSLPDYMLAKVDRASMAASLEVRVPLLDHRLVELAWSLPLDYLVQGTTGKRVLRELVYRDVPRELIDRPKMGFDPPIGDWLRGPLRSWAEELLEPDRLEAGGIDGPTVRAIWTEHLSGRRRWDYRLWTVLMWQAWFNGSPARGT